MGIVGRRFLSPLFCEDPPLLPNPLFFKFSPNPPRLQLPPRLLFFVALFH